MWARTGRDVMHRHFINYITEHKRSRTHQVDVNFRVTESAATTIATDNALLAVGRIECQKGANSSTQNAPDDGRHFGNEMHGDVRINLLVLIFPACHASVSLVPGLQEWRISYS